VVVDKKLSLLFIADGRSPITENWLRYLVNDGHSVHLVSTYPCTSDLNLASLHILPVAFGEMAGEDPKNNQLAGTRRSGISRSLLRNALPVGARTRLRQWLGPTSLKKVIPKLKRLFQEIQPELVHALRIPYEGMLAALASLPVPLILSVWGNDFTLHAGSSPLNRRYTRLALQQAAGLHVDCYRDLRLALEWGYPKTGPSMVVPTAGGIQTDVFYPTVGERPPVIINPRGFRSYVNNETFFQSIPLVLARHPEAVFLCPAMQAEAQAWKWISRLNIEGSVSLLPRQNRSQMANLFRSSQVVVSPTTHDGTPNTLLEAMACGCFPVVGDLESLREWFLPGVNGFLVNSSDVHALADAVNQALENHSLRESAAEHNVHLVSERAEYQRVMAGAVDFYRAVVA
jgi:glycosyltransferase involved in cell wall biosynthesis